MKNHTLPTGYLLKRFMPYFSSYKKIFIFDLICAAHQRLRPGAAGHPVGQQHGIIPSGPTSPSTWWWSLSALYLVLRGVDVLSNYYMQNTGHVMGALIETGHAA